MCQLNLYIVPSNIPEEEIIKIFEKYKLNISVESDYNLNELEEKFKFYSNSYHCDCDSIISRLQKEDASSFENYKIKKKNDDIEKLNKMKMLKPTDELKNYKRKYRKLSNQIDRLIEVLDRFREPIVDYEIKEREKIYALNLQDEEKSKMIEEILNPKLEEMNKKLENKVEYQNVLKDFNDNENKLVDFVSKNKDLNDTMIYNIADFEKRIAEHDFSDFICQFKNLKNLYKDLLKLSDKIYIYPFWQNDEAIEVKGVRQVDINNLDIEDLVFLPYNNLLKIESAKDK